MEDDILKSVKKNLGIADSYDVFDEDILTFINTAMGITSQLGLGPSGGIDVSSTETSWTSLNLSITVTNVLRSYVFLKVRMLFDPPTTSYLLSAMADQIKEFETRLSYWREWELNPVDPLATSP